MSDYAHKITIHYELILVNEWVYNINVAEYGFVIEPVRRTLRGEVSWDDIKSKALTAEKDLLTDLTEPRRVFKSKSLLIPHHSVLTAKTVCIHRVNNGETFGTCINKGIETWSASEFVKYINKMEMEWGEIKKWS